MGSNSNNPNAYDELKFNLIDRVKKYPAIWDKNHEQHHNRYILHQHWKRIAADMGVKGMNEEKIKKVWRNLRQEFGKQARRILRAGTETLDSASPTWPFFAPLLFLKEQFNPSADAPADPDMDETFDEFGDEFSYERAEMSPSPVRSRSPSELSGSPAMNVNGDRYAGMNHGPNFSSNSGGSSRKRKHSGSAEDMRVALLQQQQQQLRQQKYEEARLRHHQQQQQKYRDEDDSRDEDIGFFNSLLPHVRQLHPQQKMMFRLRVQQQLYELIYGPYDPHQRLAYANSSSQGEPLCTAVYGGNNNSQ